MQLYNTKLIRNFIKNKSITEKEFCSICSISKETFNKLMANSKLVRIPTIFKVTQVLQIPLKQFIKNSYFKRKRT